MANIYDYLKWRGDVTFEASPFNEIDALILSQVVYVDYEGIIPKRGTITLAEASERFFELHPIETFEGLKYARRKPADALCEIMKAPRFAGVKLSNFVCETSEEEESQFCAMLVGITKSESAIVFRGTDGTVVGWRENFNLGYKKVTSGQLKAVDYVNKAAKSLLKKYYIVGHSKGGNLAMYSAAFCEESVKNRIMKVFNFDGPGFLEATAKSRKLKEVLPKIQTYVPESSIIGRLLEHREPVTVVASSEKGFMQHDQLSWQMMGTSFDTLDTTDAKSQFIDATLKNWMKTMDNKQLKMFVEAIFGTLEEMNMESLDELSDMKPAQWKDLYKAGAAQSKENQGILGTALHLLISEGGKQVMSVFKSDDEEKQ